MDKGGENEVFYDGAATIYKLNNFEYAGDDLENFFIRIFAHNRFFNNVPYSLIGFSYNSQKEFCAVLTQPYIKAEREATEDEIAEHMQALGFEMDYYDEFHNEEYEIFDAVPNNVLYGIDGALYFIDTQIRLREDGKRISHELNREEISYIYAPNPAYYSSPKKMAIFLKKTAVFGGKQFGLLRDRPQSLYLCITLSIEELQ